MKTLVLITHSSSLTGGGEEDFLRLIRFLSGKYNLIGIFPEGKQIDLCKKYVNDFLVIPDRMFPFTEFNSRRYAGYFIKGFKKIPLIKKFLSGRKVDLVYIHSSVCIFEAIAVNQLNIRYVISIREFINPLFIRKIIYKFYLRTAKNIIVISKILFEEFEKINYRAEKLNLVYPGIENPIIENSNNHENFIFLSIGNVFPEKGQDKVIQAFGKIKNLPSNCLLKIIGSNVDNKYYDSLKSIVKKLNLENQVIFTGELSKDKVISEISGSKAVIISSKFEGFSLVLLEALSNKKPVISTRVGVVSEVIDHGKNGLLYDFSDIDSLKNNMEQLMQDHKLYRDLMENGLRTYQENFSLSNSLSSIESTLISSMSRE